MEYTRREAFARLFKPAARVARAMKEPSPSDWVSVGLLASFPFGERTPVNGGAHVILSDAYGLHAHDAGTSDSRPGSIARPLRLAADGVVWLNVNAAWPSGSYLSIMTGERIQNIEENET